MKGTAPRGRTGPEDVARRAALAVSTKDRAENAMIVDMMRNDMGRIARRGSVQVLSAFDVEKYPTLFQMTSTVAAKTAAPLAELFQAMFPAASITAHTKIRTMQIIRELEPDAQGVLYRLHWLRGARRQAQFNVAIRTCHDRSRRRTGGIRRRRRHRVGLEQERRIRRMPRQGRGAPTQRARVRPSGNHAP